MKLFDITFYNCTTGDLRVETIYYKSFMDAYNDAFFRCLPNEQVYNILETHPFGK